MAGIDSSRFKSIQSQSAISYSDPRYWNARYCEKGNDPKQDLSFAAFEWYARYDQLKELLQPILKEATPPTPPQAASEDQEQPLPEKPRILVLGCGTSTLSEELYNEGYTYITNVDSCEALIEHLSAKHDAKENFDSVACNAQNLPQDWNSQFDVVLDKACLDVIACGKDAREAVPATLSCISRVLKPLTGVYVSISHAAPELRQPMLSGTNNLKVVVSKKNRWRVSCQAIPKPLGPAADPNAKGGAPKGGAFDLKPSPAFRAEEHVYNMYVCRRPPLLADDASSWFDFWASPESVLTRETLSRSMIKSLYVAEEDRNRLRAIVGEIWNEEFQKVENIQREQFIGIAERLFQKFVGLPEI